MYSKLKPIQPIHIINNFLFRLIYSALLYKVSDEYYAPALEYHIIYKFKSTYLSYFIDIKKYFSNVNTKIDYSKINTSLAFKSLFINTNFFCVSKIIPYNLALLNKSIKELDPDSNYYYFEINAYKIGFIEPINNEEKLILDEYNNLYNSNPIYIFGIHKDDIHIYFSKIRNIIVLIKTNPHEFKKILKYNNIRFITL